MPLLEVERLAKTYGAVQALQGVTFSVSPGEFLAIIGPSGSGKSTLLKIVAGVEPATQGEVRYRGQKINADGPSPTDIIMVWQSLALFPHMTVGGNVGFGLTVRRIPVPEKRRRVAETLGKVGLAGYESRRIHELSGGEQQRIALARALAVRPQILLLDEPLGALDAQRRAELQGLLRDLHRSTGTTILMVTHDQSEALALASRVVVLHEGKVEQAGTPRAVSRQPRTPFVARFVGRKNVFSGTVASAHGKVVTIATAAGSFSGMWPPWVDAEPAVGMPAAYVVAPDRVSLGPGGENQVEGRLEGWSIAGSAELVRLDVQGIGLVQCEIREESDLLGSAPTRPILLHWATSDAFVLPA
jgi:ABC-type Fe3+/spermidine/putrescine transport system ATPase subunit